MGQKIFDYRDIVFFDNGNPSNWPTISTTDVSNITANTAITGGVITYSGPASVSARGVCWGISHDPTIEGNHTEDGTGTGTFTSNLSGLSVNTTYYVRAYATNVHGTYYGKETSFTTNDGAVIVTTNSVTNVTPTSATCGGSVTVSSGNTFPITSRGVCWATTHNPTIDNAYTSDGSGVGTFTSSITGLTVNTNYYVRAYATNEVGTFYGEEKNFNTTMGLAIVTTKDITDIHPLSATCGGIVTSDNGFTVTSRGVCWSTVQNPTTDDSHTTNGNGIGEFNSLLENLQNSTTYYVRAYAINANGTAYGENKSFTTTSGEITVTTNDVTNIGPVSAIGGGNATVSDDNDLPITAKGVCWSTGHNPMVSGSHTTDGTGTGEFTSTISELSINTLYYVRAYATNQLDTYYGEEKLFTTVSGLPMVTTTNVSMSDGFFVSGGNVTSDGGFPVTARGICYGIYPNPDLTSAYTHTTDGSGTGYFTSVIDSSMTGTIYVRAYATNANGTTYGAQVVVNLSYLSLPTFTHNGCTYKVAPDPHTSYSESISWTYANSYCNNLAAYGYSDWRMPTLDELQTMYINRVAIGGFINDTLFYHYYNNDTIYEQNLSFYHSSSIDTGTIYHFKILWCWGIVTSDDHIENGYWIYYNNNGSDVYRGHVRPIRVEN